jgi:hypothetical protein
MYDVFSNSSNLCCRKCNWPSDTNVTECLIFQYVLLSLKKDASQCPTLCNPVVQFTHTIFQCISVKYLFWLLHCLWTNCISYSLCFTSRWHFWQKYFSMTDYKLAKLSVHFQALVANKCFPQPACFCILLSSMLSILRIYPKIFDCWLVHLNVFTHWFVTSISSQRPVADSCHNDPCSTNHNQLLNTTFVFKLFHINSQF